MGTRSHTHFFQNGKPFAAFYRQFDGYPEGHGAELGKILAGITLVNGYQMDMQAGEFANGPGCLAAQVVTALKSETGIGGIYLISPEVGQDGWQEFEYHIHCNNKDENALFTPRGEQAFECYVEVRDPKDLIFTGTFEEFYAWAQNPPRSPEGDYLVTKGRVAKLTKVRVYRDLRDALQHESVRVRFTKADGSKRTMNCTTDINEIPEEFLNTASDKPLRVDPHLFKVFDLDKQAWRSFREERIIDWNIN